MITIVTSANPREKYPSRSEVYLPQKRPREKFSLTSGLSHTQYSYYLIWLVYLLMDFTVMISCSSVCLATKGAIYPCSNRGFL